MQPTKFVQQLTGQPWSFASKIRHFFVNGDRYPIYDSFCRDMILYHLGRNLYPMNTDNPYRSFTENLDRLRELSGLSVTLRELDRYLWLTLDTKSIIESIMEPTNSPMERDISMKLSPFGPLRRGGS